MLGMGIVDPQLILFATVQNLVFYLKVQPILLYLVLYLCITTQKVKSQFIQHLGAQVKHLKNPNTIQCFSILFFSYFYSV